MRSNHARPPRGTFNPAGFPTAGRDRQKLEIRPSRGGSAGRVAGIRVRPADHVADQDQVIPHRRHHPPPRWVGVVERDSALLGVLQGIGEVRSSRFPPASNSSRSRSTARRCVRRKVRARGRRLAWRGPKPVLLVAGLQPPADLARPGNFLGCRSSWFFPLSRTTGTSVIPTSTARVPGKSIGNTSTAKRDGSANVRARKDAPEPGGVT